MKIRGTLILLLLLPLVFVSCSGSDTFQGKWKALDKEGNKFEISFSPSVISIMDSVGTTKKYKYTQTGIQYENSVYTYTLKLEDGRGYQLYFPTKDESVGLIRDENGQQMFTIGRKDFVAYDDIYQLN